jgi:hypothetical protein
MTRKGPRSGPTTAQLRDAIDRGRTGSKVPYEDPAAAPLGTDEEAAGTPPRPEDIRTAMRNELRNRGRHSSSGRDANAAMGVRRTKPKRATRRP